MSETGLQKDLNGALAAFSFQGEFNECHPFGNGHINDTYIASYTDHGQTYKYTVQHMNKLIFQNPVELMENLVGVTGFLKKKIIAAGGDPYRETLDFICTKDGNPYFIDQFGEYWRAYRFVDHAYSLDKISSAQDFYESAVAFGRFQSMLSDYPVETLHEIIAGFHDTVSRFHVFQEAVRKDVAGRAAGVEKEIRFYLEREHIAHILGDLQQKGILPLRVTHNDTKSNNVLIDETTGKGICVIDLDTVMPGLSVNDFGDSIRFGASTAAEDEKDLSRVSCDLSLYETYAKGFIEGCGGNLTKDEIYHLPTGALVMTYECGMRFLTDYLSGDTYFKTAYPTHNLDRARTQMTLVADMEQKWDQIREITDRCLAMESEAISHE